jgi:ectoine hydroxylase-related dioxygenase (phytanoyl-CoA dioxygenase family)
MPQTTQPLLSKQYNLSGEMIRQYREDGHVMIPGLGAPEIIETYRPLIAGTLADVARRNETQGRLEEYSRFFLQVTNVWQLNEQAKEFTFARRFAQVAAALMGVPAVRLYHDQALFKPARGKPTPWHQDQFYWPLRTPHAITMWMPLVDLTAEMGGMMFASGSHREGSLASLAISPESHDLFDRLISERHFPLRSYTMKAGDATFHAGWTVHAAHPNTSDTVREVMTVIYFADGETILEPDNKFRQTDMEVFFPGLSPGDDAASPLNPILYPA